MPLRMMERDRIHDGSQTQYDVAPALATGRPMIEFSQYPSELGLLRFKAADAGRCQPVEYSEFLFPQALIKANVHVLPAASSATEKISGLARASIGRRKEDIGPIMGHPSGIPATKCARLIATKIAQRHVGIAIQYIDTVNISFNGSVSRNIACALAVPNDRQCPGPMRLDHRCSPLPKNEWAAQMIPH
jgi:hypothetical protein